ncbi:MAG: CoA-binding protein [Bacteroidota bacterium]
MVKTLVFGASTNPSRYSNLAIRRWLENNIETVAFGVREGTVSEVQIKTNLGDFQNVHTITLYINPTRQTEYYQQILDLKPQRVIFNPGTENPELFQMLTKAGIKAENSCTLVLLATGQF